MMYKRVLIALIIMLAVVAVNSLIALADPNWSEINKNYAYILTRITGTDQAGVGSGFIVRDAGGQRYIVTNFHVIRTDNMQAQLGQQIMVVFHNRLRSGARILKIDPLHDLAILQVDSIPNSISGIDLVNGLGNTNNLQYGTKLYKIGSSLGQFDMPASGLYCYARQLDQLNFPFVRYLLVKIDCNLGDSGCPVFDESGKLAGICFAGEFYTVLHLPQNIMGVLPAEIVAGRFNWMINKQQNGVLSGVEVVGFDDQIINNTQRDGGLIVTRSNHQGLQAGDVILRVQDQKINDVKLLDYIIRSFNMGDSVGLRIIRNGVEQNITITL